jgi:hypothetical protein
MSIKLGQDIVLMLGIFGETVWENAFIFCATFISISYFANILETIKGLLGELAR